VKSVCCDHEELNRYKVIELWWLSCNENFVSERNYFIFNSFRNFKPVKRFTVGVMCWNYAAWTIQCSSSKNIPDVLETICLIFWKSVVQRVAVVKLGVYVGGAIVLAVQRSR